jgi:GMP synthase-like glutamine amidotransferase
MNLLIVNGYDRLGWKRLAKHNIQPICEFYRDQLKKINPKIKSTFIYPSMDLKTTFDDSFFHSFDGIVWTGSSLNIYDNTKEIKNQITLMKKISKLPIKIFGSCWGMQLYTVCNGGTVSKNIKGREIGISFNISLNNYGKAHKMYKKKPLIFDAFASHLDHVTKLPKKSVALSDNHYSIQSLTTNNFWGTQYHPEFNFRYTGQILKARKKLLLDEKLFSKNQIESLILSYKNPHKDSYSNTVNDFKIRTLELANWLKFLRQA